MHYEIHITVANGFRKKKAFAEACQLLGAKPLHIMLAQGDTLRQMMCSRKLRIDEVHSAKERDEEALLRADELESAFLKAGFDILRTKVEAADMYGEAEYYEQHIKLHPMIAYDPAQAARRGLGFSTELLSGTKYLTWRCYGSLSMQRQKNWDVHDKLKGLLFQDLHDERVLLDTNPEMDEGWL